MGNWAKIFQNPDFDFEGHFHFAIDDWYYQPQYHNTIQKCHQDKVVKLSKKHRHVGYVLTAMNIELGNRYPPDGALAYRRVKARASDLPPQ